MEFAAPVYITFTLSTYQFIPNFLGLMMVNVMVRLNVYPSTVRLAMLYNPDDENYHRSQKFMKLILKHFVTWNCDG